MARCDAALSAGSGTAAVVEVPEIEIDRGTKASVRRFCHVAYAPAGSLAIHENQGVSPPEWRVSDYGRLTV